MHKTGKLISRLGRRKKIKIFGRIEINWAGWAGVGGKMLRMALKNSIMMGST